MKNVRVWFQKTGAVKYISHLDLTRCMARALKLSKLPVWYTEGFNPRIYMTFAMPLSLGVSGEKECMDIRFVEEISLTAAASRLNACLPKDLSVLRISEPEMPFEAIAFAEYEFILEAEDPLELSESIHSLFAEDAVLVKPDSTDTCVLNRTESIKGVYNINKGYAVFKQVNILCESDDYYIVESGSDYGLSNYDHIALNGADVDENDVVF